MATTVEVTRQRDIHGRKQQYVARLGDFDGAGSSKAEALASLYDRIGRYSSMRRRYLFTADGDVFVVYPTVGGYAYDIASRERKWASSCFLPNDDEAQALKRAEEHAAQSFGGVVGRN